MILVIIQAMILIRLNRICQRGPMKPIDLFMQFFRREGWIYAIGLTMLMAIDVAFLFVPQFIGNAIDTLSNNKEEIGRAHV